jgi:UDP-GlcNAc:undecaprenyl-phosphate GlcNAc-1-phosphate transferase
VLILCLAAFLEALAASALITPAVRALALGRDLVDRPNHRKVHTGRIPRLGGVSLGGAILLAAGVIALVSPSARFVWAAHATRWGTLMAGAALLGLVGLFDDLRTVTPRTKLLFQVLAGLLAFWGGNQFRFFEGGVIGQPAGEVLNLAATLFWIVAITNAMNLIDGLDGLAAGITAIAIMALGIIAWGHGHQATALLAAVVAGAVIGFLPFNLHPARIFLGDSGSFLLGYLLATLSIQTLQQQAPVSSSVVILFLFSVPLLDTTLAIVRRTLRGHDVFAADGNHIHHRLLRQGIGHGRSVLILWGTSLLFGGMAIGLSLFRSSHYAGLLQLGAILLLVIAAARLGALEVRDLLHVVRGNERRRRSPRDLNLAVRRAVKEVPAQADLQALRGRLIALAREIDLDLLEIDLDLPAAKEARTVQVVQWMREGSVRPEGPEAIATTSAMVGGSSGVRGTVVLGKERWKLRRQSEEDKAWAHLLAEGLGSHERTLVTMLARSGTAAPHGAALGSVLVARAAKALGRDLAETVPGGKGS